MKRKILQIISFVVLMGFIATGCEHRYYERSGHYREHRHHYHDDDDGYRGHNGYDNR